MEMKTEKLMRLVIALTWVILALEVLVIGELWREVKELRGANVRLEKCLKEDDSFGDYRLDLDFLRLLHVISEVYGNETEEEFTNLLYHCGRIERRMPFEERRRLARLGLDGGRK